MLSKSCPLGCHRNSSSWSVEDTFENISIAPWVPLLDLGRYFLSLRECWWSFFIVINHCQQGTAGDLKAEFWWREWAVRKETFWNVSSENMDLSKWTTAAPVTGNSWIMQLFKKRNHKRIQPMHWIRYVRAISLCHIKSSKAQRGKGMWKTAEEEKADSMLCIILYTGIVLLLLFSFAVFLATVSVSQRVSGSVKGMNSSWRRHFPRFSNHLRIHWCHWSCWILRNDVCHTFLLHTQAFLICNHLLVGVSEWVEINQKKP